MLVFGKLVINVKWGELCRRNIFKEIFWIYCIVLLLKIIMLDGIYNIVLGFLMLVVINRLLLVVMWFCCNDYVINFNL